MNKTTPEVEGIAGCIPAATCHEALGQLIALVHRDARNHGQSKEGQAECNAKKEKICSPEHGRPSYPRYEDGSGVIGRISCYTQIIILFLVSLSAAALSLLVTWAASGIVKPIIVIPGFFILKLSYNSGIAFSISIPSPWEEILITFALTAVCVFAVKSKPDRLLSTAFGLIIGGAIANLIDRLPDGLVTDYVAVGTFPVFNAADSCITIGAVLLFVEAWLKRPKKP